MPKYHNQIQRIKNFKFNMDQQQNIDNHTKFH